MTYEDYGTAVDNLNAIRDAVQEKIGLVFSTRENLAYGEYYFARLGNETWTLHSNFDVEIGRPLPGYPSDAKVMLHVEYTDRSEEIYNKLAGVSGLYRVGTWVVRRPPRLPDNSAGA